MKTRSILIAALLTLSSLAAVVQAGTVACPNSAAAALGNGGLTTPFRSAARTYQVVINASELASIPIGTPITGMAFRQNNNITGGNVAFPNVAATFADYTIRIASSPNPPATMSLTFADNIGPDVVTVRTGALNLAVGAIPAGGVNNWAQFSVLAFANNYVYNGGHISITISTTGNTQAVNPAIDALTTGGAGYNTLINAISANAANATTGTAQFATTVLLQHPLMSVSGGKVSLYSDGVDTGVMTATLIPAAPAGTPTVTANLTAVGGGNAFQLFDDGPGGGHGDAVAGNNVFSNNITVAPGTSCGNITVPISASDTLGNSAIGSAVVQSVSHLTVPAGAVDENDPGCGLPTDTINGGCNITPNVYTTIPACGSTITGTLRTTTTPAGSRDTDWWKFTLTQETQVTFTAVAEADMVCGFVQDTTTVGTTPPVCGSTTLAITPFVQVIPCQKAVVTTCLQPGDWTLFVSTPFAFTMPIPCGRKYYGTLRCGGGTCPGDLNADGARNGLDVQTFVNEFPGCEAVGFTTCTSCQTSDVNGDGLLDANDITALANLLVVGAPCP